MTTFYHISKNYSYPIVVTKEVLSDGTEKYFLGFDIDGFEIEYHEITNLLFEELMKLHEELLKERKEFEQKYK